MTNFSDLELDARVLKAIDEAGYTSPTPIQEQAIPHALQGRDVLGIAQTGTGKTASFTLPMLTMLAKGRARARMPRSLVLAPTRELAAQVAENFETYAKNIKLSMALLIGGTSFKDQDRLIDRGVDVLIATPGRLLDHFERGKLMLTGVQIMVVDEADRMLDMGFIPDIERIFKLTPFTRQTMFYSATMAPEITRITQEFLSNPVRVEVARQATTSETIEQLVCKHRPSRRDRSDKDKRDLLRALITAEGGALTNGIIFCNRKRDVDVVAKSLKKHGFDAAPIHGDLDQSIRTRTLDGFRGGDLRLLVASDVAARGLDIPAVSHVFNFDVPIHSEDYVHRIGRTGRAGRSGKAITLCLPADEKYLEKIEELVKKKIPVIDSLLTPASSEGEPAKKQDSAPKAERAATKAKPEREQKRDSEEATGGSSRKSRSRGSSSRRSDDRARVVGMGNHVPAFLMRDFRASDHIGTAAKPAAKPDTLQEAEETPENPVEDVTQKVEVPTEAEAVEVQTDGSAPEAPEDNSPTADNQEQAREASEPPAADTKAQDATDAPAPRKRKSRARASAAQVIGETLADSNDTVEQQAG